MSQGTRKPTRKPAEQSATLVPSRSTTSKKRTATPDTPTNAPMKRRKQVTAPAPQPPAPDRAPESDTSDEDDQLPDQRVFLANITTPPRPSTTPEPPIPVTTLTSPRTQNRRAPISTPAGFYRVSLSANRYLRGENAASSFEVQNEIRQWGLDRWAHLHDPPDFLEIQHFVQAMAPAWTNEEAATAHQYSEATTGTAINMILQHPIPSTNSQPTNELCLAQLQVIATQSQVLLKRVDEYVHSLNLSRQEADSRFNL